MNDKIRHILEQIKLLEEEIQSEMSGQRSRFLYQIHGRRIQFERSIKMRHRSLKLGVFHWFLMVRPQNYLTA